MGDHPTSTKPATINGFWPEPDNPLSGSAGEPHIEISIPQPGGWRMDELAALTARLCQQAVSWDDRTRLPTPLHLAQCADEDHPRYEPEHSEA
ncbi:RNaseH domain-containing protein [Nocardia wallacei]|uniref:RNaseH domain-containing protein n=1 Tax=Nocardia wallacei TaxID=480035 RepID=UPI001657575E